MPLLSPKEKSAPPHPTVLLLLSSVIVIAFIHAWAAFFPDMNDWGVHLFAFFPGPLRIILSLLMLVCVLPPVQKVLLGFIRLMVEQWQKSAHRTRIFLPIVVLSGISSLFWIVRERTTFLGDGLMLARSIQEIDNTAGLRSTFGHEPLTGYIIWNVYRVFNGEPFNIDGHLAFAVVGIICGIAFLIILAIFTFKITHDTIDRLWLYVFLVASAGTQLFFGYVENYTPAYFGYVIFLLTGILYIRGSVSLLIPSLVFAILFVLYFGMLAFAPALLLLYIDSFRQRKITIAVLSFAATIIIIGLLLTICDYPYSAFFDRFSSRESHVLPLHETGNGSLGFSMFSYRHLIELINVNLLFSPLALILFFVLLISNLKTLEWKNREWLFMVLNACCGLGMTIIFKSDIGLGRDWDLLAVFELSVAVAAGYLLIRSPYSTSLRQGLFVAISVVTLLHTAGFILINASEERAVARANVLFANAFWGQRAYTVYEELAIYSRDHNDLQGAISNYKRFFDYDSANPRIWGNLADVYHATGNKDSEMVCDQQAIHFNTKNKNVYINLAKIYVQRQRIDEAQELTLKGVMSDTPTADTLTDLGIYCMKIRKDYLKALEYFEHAIKLDSTYSDAYLNAGLAYYALHDLEKMKPSFTKFLQLQPNSPKAETIRNLSANAE